MKGEVMTTKKKSASTASRKSASVKRATGPIKISLRDGFTREELFAKLTPAKVKQIQAAHNVNKVTKLDINKHIP